MNTSVWTAAGISHRDRLAELAQSANETARMARFNVSLSLLVALYLTLTLLSTSDESLLRNAVVTLPQFEAGISLERSYLFAPIAFLYLHVQTLFLLVVLARKVYTFEKTLGIVFRNDNVSKAECRDWLSAITLVQGLQGTGNFAVAARVLTWVGTVGLPLLLLFLIDTSFLRYQSAGISTIHHVCFTVDLAAVWLYWRRIRPGDLRSRQESTKKLVLLLNRAMKPMAQCLSAILLALLWAFAWPKGHFGHEYKEPKEATTHFNPFDDLLCSDSSWRGFCRTLHLHHGTLVRSRSDGGTAGLPEEFDAKKVDHYRRVHGLDLRNRSLRSAYLTETYLLGALLEGADLRGANLSRSELHGADLTRAELHGADLRYAKLHGAVLFRTELHGANLWETELHGADLRRAEMTHGANLRSTKLHGANLFLAKLHRANLQGTEFHGANLSDAELHGADLSGALLVGTKLTDTELHAAKLVEAFVIGTEGSPEIDDKTTFQDVVWSIDELPHPEQCADDTIPCHMEDMEVRTDLPLAWRRNVSLVEHLRGFVGTEQFRPTWLPEKH